MTAALVTTVTTVEPLLESLNEQNNYRLFFTTLTNLYGLYFV